MRAVTHLEKVITGEVSAVTHLEKVIAEETSAVTYTEKVIAGEATPITHLQKVIAGITSPVTHLEQVWAGGSPTPTEHEYTGAVPVTITADGTPLLDCLISGNMEQSGTPTSDNPIQPQGTGERMGNLFDKDKQAGNIYVTETITRYGVEIPVEAGTYAIVGGTNKLFVKVKYGTIYETPIDTSAQRIVTLPQNGYILVYAGTEEDYTVSNIMLNSGSTALPYEPYGYKLDISSGGENLFDKDLPFSETGRFLKDDGTIDTSGAFNITEYIECDASTDYSLSNVNGTSNTPSICYYDSSKNYISGKRYGGNTGVSFTTPNTCKYVRFSVRNDKLNEAMFNLGSTAKPYSPYNRTTTPVYLGEVETTRKIRKYEFTGKENWSVSTNAQNRTRAYTTEIASTALLPNALFLCSHYTLDNVTSYPEVNKVIINTVGTFVVGIDATVYADATAFKDYLAAQYANGTPVTVWYVLATEETGIVNEPLMKIGDYADTLSMEQAGVSIPTLNGQTVIDVDTTLKPSQMYIKYKR